MQATAHLKYARISPRKVSIVGELIRGQDVGRARAILLHTPKAASELLVKVLDSACANAESRFDADRDGLYVSEVLIGPGPTLKRMHARAKGRGYRILKRTSHITVTVAERDGDES
ncbi:MAG: 50S ribosomal protein L22 [Oscillospiraceae bacterium]|jgi:large subunit ribosomal protein L22|nr:50S ribosomal protein L22 [Oscillospiraceae bacterium]